MKTGMTVGWADFGRTRKPGDYRVGDITIHVTHDNIETWQTHPTARFNVNKDEDMDGVYYDLRTYDV